MSPPSARSIPRRILRIVAVGLLVMTGLEAMAEGGAEAAPPVLRTQTIQLVEGWNAVFLEVEPLNGDPESVFAGLPIELVGAYLPRSSNAQFVGNPSANLFRRAGWGIWYAGDRPDAFLKTLHAIHGRQSYLIQSRQAFTWTITGQVVSDEIRWQPGAFNLVGFSVADPGAPTFAQFFQGSPAHRHDRIYRLDRGNWRRVADPSSELMRSGEAFWIYCDGSSGYQGPLSVQTGLGRQLLLGPGTDNLTLRNATDHPITATVELVPTGGEPVPVSILVTAMGGGSLTRTVAAAKPASAWSQPLPPLEPGAAVKLPFEARREEMSALYQTSLLKVSTDLGTVSWVPVVALRKDLEEQ